MKFFNKFRKDEEGATVIEYVLIAALISVAAIATFTATGDEINDLFGDLNTRIDSVNANP